MYRPSSCWFRTATSSGSDPSSAVRRRKLLDHLTVPTHWLTDCQGVHAYRPSEHQASHPEIQTPKLSHVAQRLCLLTQGAAFWPSHVRPVQDTPAVNALLIVPCSLLTGGHMVIRQSQHATRWVTVKLRKLSLRTVSRLSRLHGACCWQRSLHSTWGRGE